MCRVWRPPDRTPSYMTCTYACEKFACRPSAQIYFSTTPRQSFVFATMFRSSDFLLPLEQAGFSDIVSGCVCASGA